MKLFVFLLFVSSLSFAQKADVYSKKGIANSGYDVVAYFSGSAQKGIQQFSYEHQGTTYRFASEENLKAFIENPKQYLPAYGGYCAYAIAKKSKKVKVDPETFEIRDGRLFLFYNAWGTNTLTLWQEENPENLVMQADKNWVTLP